MKAADSQAVANALGGWESESVCTTRLLISTGKVQYGRQKRRISSADGVEGIERFSFFVVITLVESKSSRLSASWTGKSEAQSLTRDSVEDAKQISANQWNPAESTKPFLGQVLLILRICNSQTILSKSGLPAGGRPVYFLSLNNLHSHSETKDRGRHVSWNGNIGAGSPIRNSCTFFFGRVAL